MLETTMDTELTKVPSPTWPCVCEGAGVDRNVGAKTRMVVASPVAMQEVRRTPPRAMEVNIDKR